MPRSSSKPSPRPTQPQRPSGNDPTATTSSTPSAPVVVKLPAPLVIVEGNNSAANKEQRDHIELFESEWHNYVQASGLAEKPLPLQLSTLICALGGPAQQLQLQLSDEQRSTVSGVLIGLRQLLCGEDDSGGERNMRIDRMHFNQAEQGYYESYADYFDRLRQLLSHCRYESKEIEDEFLLDRILSSIRDRAQRNRLAEARDLSVDQAIMWCLRHERYRTDRQEYQRMAAVRDAAQNDDKNDNHDDDYGDDDEQYDDHHQPQDKKAFGPLTNKPSTSWNEEPKPSKPSSSTSGISSDTQSQLSANESMPPTYEMALATERSTEPMQSQQRATETTLAIVTEATPTPTVTSESTIQMPPELMAHLTRLAQEQERMRSRLEAVQKNNDRCSCM